MVRSRERNGLLDVVVAVGLVAAAFVEGLRRPERGAPGPPPPSAGDEDHDAAGGDAPPPSQPGGLLDRVLDRLDRGQRRFPATAFAFGVVKKFSEDRAGQLAALVAYYSFFSVFPLLLVLVTVLRFVLAGNEELQRRILDSAVAQFPVVGDDLSRNVDAIEGSAVALALGMAGAIWGGLRAMVAAQTALDEVWDVPMFERRNFLLSRLRGLLLMALLAVGLLGSIAVANVAAFVDELPGGGRLALHAGSILLDVAVVGAAYLVLTDLPLRVRQILPGAILGGTAYWGLQLAGSVIVQRTMSGAEGAYGTFAVVIGLLTWLFVVAQVSLLAAEINVVWCRRLWPRSLTGRDLTDADVRAFRAYAQQAKRSDVVRVRVSELARPGADITGAAQTGDGDGDGGGRRERERTG